MLGLDLHGWAADGLLAVFFIAGIEVKRELAVGELSDARAAALPFLAAAGGMVVPALVAIAVSGGAALDDGAWAIPVATDIAFALGVLALAGAALPSGVRVLLLSMAVIDDLAAIALVAVLFTAGISLPWLAAAAAAAALFRGTFAARLARAWVLWPLAVACWIAVLPVAMLGAIGYTVALLIAGLAFDGGEGTDEASAAVLAASVTASVIAVVLLRRRAREPV